jgi:twinkle protein
MRTSKTSKVVRHEQCPSCAAKGEDNSANNLAVYDDGHSFCFRENLYYPPEGGAFNSLNTFTYEYIPFRGIEKDALVKYNILTKVDADGKPISRGYVYPNGATQVEGVDKKEFYWASGVEHAAGLFGMDKFSSGEHDSITIVEGAKDAASLYQTTRTPVVAVQSAASAVADCSVGRSFLNGFKRIILALDGDIVGRAAADNVAALFDPNKLYQIKFDKYKDPNDYLKAGEGTELLNLWHNVRRYQPENIVSTFADFDKILKETPRAGIPYPWPSLNDMTYGIRTSEIVLLTAQEGIGKTELMHAIEHQILKETPNEVSVGAIFLEEPKRRHLQAISGIELQRPVHLPDCICEEGEVFSALQRVVGVDERLHLYSHIGSDDPDLIADTIRFLVSARNCRYILLDHISMVVSGLIEADERRTLDYLMTKLDMQVHELDYALILVSHVNDFGQTRGSRYISKAANIRIDAVRDPKHADPIARNTTELTVSKNRFAGKTGLACKLLFDTNTHTYSELTDASQWSPANDNTPEWNQSRVA